MVDLRAADNARVSAPHTPDAAGERSCRLSNSGFTPSTPNIKPALWQCSIERDTRYRCKNCCFERNLVPPIAWEGRITTYQYREKHSKRDALLMILPSR